MLMSSQDRYISYNLSFKISQSASQQSQIILQRKKSSKKDVADLSDETCTIRYFLSQVHVCSIDDEDKRNLCKDRSFYTLNFVAKKSRKVYFTTFSEMRACIEEIIRLQGFKNGRLSQYEVVKKMVTRAASSSSDVGEYALEDETPAYLVRHHLTGKMYRVKEISDELP